ncbi:MAG: hypothetical protein ABIQ02_04660 [Saprospiraceae bacterium]
MVEDIGWRKYAGRFRTYDRLIDSPPGADVRMIICIPICAEPDLALTLDSLYEARQSDIHTEVILLFNKNDKMQTGELELHDQSWKQSKDWIAQHQSVELKFFPVYIDHLPDPKGGVGWARKMAMDEAARRLDSKGIIVCLDADCTVASNYIAAIFRHFEVFKKQDAASIFYEHHIDHLDLPQRNAIVLYELHLRYLINAQKWCGHPYAFSTVGSAMAVRRKAYLDQGGMNTRSAGEDFYFLQKFIEIGTHDEIKNTTVFPSARISSRVPFGTGRAMFQILQEKENWLTTDFQIFHRIKPLFQSLDKLRDIALKRPPEESYETLQRILGVSVDLISYLKHIDFLKECHSIAINTANLTTFKQRFFRYFNSFRMMKYMHFMSDHNYPEVQVLEGASRLIREMKVPVPEFQKEDSYLQLFRKHDREKR